MPVVLACCVVLKVREARVRSSPPAGLEQFPVALAWGKHLFPFRTEQLSPTAPMVLGLRGPGRVGRRRFFFAPRAVREGGSSSLTRASRELCTSLATVHSSAAPRRR